MALSFVAQSARGAGRPPVPQRTIDEGDVDPRALPDPLARRGRPRPRQGDRRLLDLGRRARHERLDVHRARRRLDRRRRRGRAERAPSARCPGRCTAARPRACCRCSTRSSARRRRAAGSSDALDRGERLMGFGHRVYRAEDPRARVLRRTARELGSPRFEVAEALEAGRAGRAGRRASPTACWRPTSSSGRRSCSTTPRCRRSCSRRMFTCARDRRLVGAHPRAEARGAADPPDGASTSASGAAAWTRCRPERPRQRTPGPLAYERPSPPSR